MIRRLVVVAFAVLLPLLLLAGAVGATLIARQGGLAVLRVPTDGARAPATDAATIVRGEYLVRIGDCAACHTRRGGAPFAGGRAFRGDWGTLYSTNLTPDPEHGLGRWSNAEFRHAMRHGVSRRGLLYPVFPYANFARLDEADLDAIFAYLSSLPPVAEAPPANALEFPANRRGALLVWRMLHERPQPLPAVAGQSEAWQRGRYLVAGLGHCVMCHGTRGARGSLPGGDAMAGGRIPGEGWYAPPLDGAALARYDDEALAHYLRAGTSAHGSAYGAMAEVVSASLQYLSADDALAIAGYLKSLPPPPPARVPPPLVRAGVDAPAVSGARIYADHCADCHGKDGEGEPGRYPPLRDAVALTAPDPVNAVRLVLYGAAEPVTALNRRPYTMPPYAQRLDDAEIAAVVTMARATFGGRSRPVTASEVRALHGINGSD